MSIGYVEITNTLMRVGTGWRMGYHAGRIAGCGQYGYVIYGEPTVESLTRKLDKMGHKYDMPERGKR